jgi:hypothetical protein
MTETYRDLLALAARIPATPGTDGGAAQRQLDAACGQHIQEMLSDGGEPGEIIAYLNADLDTLAAAPGADPRAVQRLRESLLARFDAQARRNATRRRILLAIPAALLVLIAVTYLTLKFVNLVSLSQPVTTREGMTERAKAVRKILYYESWKLDQIPHRTARFALSVYLWPVEPTAGEVEGAREFVEEVRKASENQAEQREYGPVYCGISLDGNELGVTMALSNVSRRIISPDTKWTGTPHETLRKAIHDYACPNRAAR